MYTGRTMNGYDEQARFPWISEYPEFWQLIKSGCGEVKMVDEYGVLFWSLLPYVNIKRDHPMFSCSACSSPDPISTLSACENNALDTARRQFQADAEKIRKDCQCLRMDPVMNKSPIAINKELYLQAKQVFLNQVERE